ncbi:alkyl hydroperoxide reductase [Reichenbachiella sp. 5M10]|uniref:peroxiredoxin-like family protein n=1 Tax=Reichenbachiella sp. 5M10 TaxID=1889772 RepID=UPI000C1562D4|nr:peroxiredoxin-like family protein [Reichenbachiella sp. 5M10]PIB35701.1 alkyl hydroperoxide reductase [Reichenbachiella sp. 5M10]
MSESLTLTINTPSPNFDLIDIFDRRVNLKDYRGKKVLVAFFRHAGCPFCNIRVHRLQKRHAEFKALGLEMIFFFESEAKVLKSHAFHIDVNPIPLIADPEKVWYTKYGIESSGMKSAISHATTFFQTVIQAKMKGLPVHMMEGKESIKTIPAEFLLDEKGMVKKVHYAKNLTDRMKLETIAEFANS